MFVILVVPLVIFILGYLCLFIRQRTTLTDIPGPKPDIFLTHFFDIKIRPNYEYLGTLMKYHDLHGPVIKCYDGPLNVGILIKDAELIEHILSSNKLIDKAKRYEFIHNWLSMGLLTSTGKKWRQRRKLLTPAFHFSILNNFVEIFANVGEVFIEVLQEHVNKPSFDISPVVSLCTLDLICEAAMGVKLNAQKMKTSQYIQGVKTMCQIVGGRLYSCINPLFYKFTITYLQEWLTLKIVHGHTDNIINQRIIEKKQNKNIGIHSSNNTKPVFLDILLESTIDGKALSRLDIREEVDTFMFEGHDTTASAVSFALYSLAANPKIQKEVYIEQQTIFTNDLKNAKPTVAQLNEMKYLELVIKETLRLYPSVPYIGRKLSEDVMHKGMLLPKGIDVLLFIFAYHRDPEAFPDPLKFNPNRFLDTNRLNPYQYTPFSAGPRNCIGQRFAMLAMKSTLSKVIRNFELFPSTPKHELQLVPDTILKSKNGICISIKQRN
ncbi:cytochrome P450 4V2-like [Diabrotica undecimpunctata]|uniref:cytochrome P450 4V2-like n=1 Tax=Diabrotica undecimpunctata TaxID=50387 RepID=UPI003B63C13E